MRPQRTGENRALSKALFPQVFDGEGAGLARRCLFVMQQPFDVFGKNVNFKINMVSRLIITDNRVLPCMRNNGDFERVGSDHCRHSEADPIDGYRTLHGDILAQLDGVLNAYTAGIALGFYGKDLASAVDMTLDHVTPEPLSDCEGPLEIDPGTGCQIAERSSP